MRREARRGKEVGMQIGKDQENEVLPHPPVLLQVRARQRHGVLRTVFPVHLLAVGGVPEEHPARQHKKQQLRAVESDQHDCAEQVPEDYDHE